MVQDVDIQTNIENVACLGKTISLCDKGTLKQHLRLNLLKSQAKLRLSWKKSSAICCDPGQVL